MELRDIGKVDLFSCLNDLMHMSLICLTGQDNEQPSFEKEKQANTLQCRTWGIIYLHSVGSLNMSAYRIGTL